MPYTSLYEWPDNPAASLDLLTITSTELQRLLSNHHVTSENLVDAYMDQIKRQNHNGLRLNAMISVADRDSIRETARFLDRERQQGKIRSALHGIPITVKDNIMTGPELRLPTTVGTYALQNGMAERNAPIVDTLLQAGAIILGKANLSEMNGRKGFGVTTGWSALGGQTQSPYIKGGFKEGDKAFGHSAPGGSSSGSAAGVAAGFAPLALATETDGSIVQPASRAALYGLKATVGLVSTKGTAPWSALTDSIGGMAKSPQDLAALFELLIGAGEGLEKRSKFDGDCNDLYGPWKGLRVGFVDPTLWSFPPAICDPDPILIQQQREEMEAAITKIESCGAVVVRSVPFPSMDQLVLDGDDALEQLWNHDFRKEWKTFLGGYRNCNIRDLRDIVEFNKRFADRELPSCYPSQQLLEDAIDETKCISAAKYKEGVRILRDAARTQGIDKTLAANDLDVILGPMDGRIPTIAAAAGYPVGTMPLGYSKTNGRPFGMCIVAAAGNEDKILRAMRAWDAIIAKRKAPPQLQKIEVQAIPKIEVQAIPRFQAMPSKKDAMLKVRSSVKKLVLAATSSKSEANDFPSSVAIDLQRTYEPSSTQSLGLSVPSSFGFTEHSSSHGITAATSQSAEIEDEKLASSGFADTSTQWTTIMEAKSRRAQSFIDELSKHLCERARTFSKDRKSLDDISAALSEMLRAFSLRLEYRAQTQVHRDISSFVRQHRKLIVEHFDSERTQPDLSLEEEKAERAKRWQESLNVDVPDSTDDNYLNGKLCADEPDHLQDISRLSDDKYEDALNVGSRDDSHDYDLFHGSDDGEDADDGTHPHIDMYQRIITASAEYRWLLADMERQQTLKQASPVDLMEEVKVRLRAALPRPTRISRLSGLPGYQVTFGFPWDPLLFWKENFEEGNALALENVITITGSASDAQATTTFNYLVQTWPVTAEHVMRLVKDLLVSPELPLTAIGKLPDGTELKAHIESGRFLITATGPECTLVEVGQQFIWLAAALRSSPYEIGIATCLPIIEDVKLLTDSSFEMNVDFSFERLDGGSSGKDRMPGLCWHDIFRNPVMVKGFPIFKKPQGIGLEIPLQIMSALAGSDRVSECGGRSYIKGYSVMFFATEVLRDVLIWHYCYNSLGMRISYGDHESKSPLQISMHQLRTYRHVVGWCTECKIYAGAPDAQYDSIKPSDAPSPSSGILLDRITFSVGRIGITGSASLAIGIKDVPIYKTPKTYQGMLKWVRGIYFILWDEEDKIGWLVNGTTAVLHLARATLQLASTDEDLPEALEANLNDIKDHGPDHHPRSAIQTLWHNRNLCLWESSNKRVVKSKKETPTSGVAANADANTPELETEFFLFADLVEEVIQKIELAFDHQRDKAGKNGINLRRKFRRHLEGWDFLQFLQGPEISPRQVTLQLGGYGWVNFARSIGAVTLMGKGFGQLIQMASSNARGLCKQWHSVQKRKYYLAASILDLKNIEKHKSEAISHLQWHSPEDPLAKCTDCSRSTSRGGFLFPGTRKHNECYRNPVQTFLPKATQYINQARRPRYLEESYTEGGAVVFENVVTVRFLWKDQPEEDSNEGGDAGSSSLAEMIPGNSTDDSPNSEPSQKNTQPFTGSETPLTSLTGRPDSPVASGSESHELAFISTFKPGTNKSPSRDERVIPPGSSQVSATVDTSGTSRALETAEAREAAVKNAGKEETRKKVADHIKQIFRRLKR